MSAARMHRDDLEELARLIARELRGEKPKLVRDAVDYDAVPVTDRDLRDAADRMARRRKVRMR